MNKKWELYNSDTKKIKEVAEKYNLSEILATVLVNRDIVDTDDINVFLNPTRNDFHDPYEMPDMKLAVDRIIKAMENNEKTIIYGDYDVDGITSTTVMKKFLDEHGLKVDYKIPNRLNEGYGLNMNAIKEIAEQGYKLIITVDCGISGIEEIKYAYSLGMEVIVTDHHEPLDEIPEAVAVIDCKRKDNKYPFKSLAGCGVVFKVIQALSQRLNLPEKEYLKYLDIVCIGTISDIVPLVDENRVIAKLGLKLVAQTKNPGLIYLLKSTGFRKIDSTAISFGVAPRINACGRMGFEEVALKLFLTDNPQEAQAITEELNNFNTKRQEIEKRMFEDAKAQIAKYHMEDDPIIVLGSKEWHHGVIGIVSSKITDLYYKPSILVSFEDGIAKGSGRSIPGFDLHEALGKSSDVLLKYGGHEMAIGISLEESKFDEFREKIIQLAKEAHTDELVPSIKIDKEVTRKDINFETIENLKLLEPYGEANKTPLFIYKNLKIESIRTIAEGKHLKLVLRDDDLNVDAIAFGLGEFIEEFKLCERVDVVVQLEINEYNKNNKIIQFSIKDMRKSI